jgi:hypothetical protein
MHALFETRHYLRPGRSTQEGARLWKESVFVEAGFSPAFRLQQLITH